MTAYEYLKSLPHVPMTMHGNEPRKASNAERRRWLDQGAVVINGERPKPHDELDDGPVFRLVFFPNGKRRCTMLEYPNVAKATK